MSLNYDLSDDWEEPVTRATVRPPLPVNGRKVGPSREVGFVRESWRNQAACRGMDTNVFFPEEGGPSSGQEAKAVCAICPVADECLLSAVVNGERLGVWGGKGERQRRSIRKAKFLRERAARAPKPERAVRPPSPKHGTNYRYCAGCHCPECTAAHNDYMAGWRHGKRVSA